MEDKNKDFIAQVEKGKFKNKNLLYAVRGVDLANIGVNYGSSFLIPAFNYFVTTGNMVGVVLTVSTLFSRGIINSGFNWIRQKIYVKYSTEFEKYTTEKKLELLEKAKNLVTEEISIIDVEEKKERTLEQSEVIDKLGRYIASYKSKLSRMFSIYCDVAAAGVALGGVAVTSFMTGTNMFQTLGFLTAGFGLGALNVWYTNKIRKDVNARRKTLITKTNRIENEIVNKDIISKQDHEYNISQMKVANGERAKVQEESLNISNRSMFTNNAIFATIIAILAFSNMDTGNLANLLTMTYFYTDIGGKVWMGLRSYEDFSVTKQDYEQDLEQVRDIIKQVEMKKDLLKTPKKEFSSLEIKDFNGVFYSKISEDSKDYRACKLHIPNLSVRKGEKILITGESGSGKTTFIEMLKKGDINNRNGICIDEGETIDYLGDTALVYKTSMQLTTIESVLKVITCGKDVSMLSAEEKERLTKILRGLNLDKTDITDPFGKDKYLKELENKVFTEFSQGQKQRLVLAKVLYSLKPEHQMVIFDEPTSNLDKESAQQVFEFITEFCNHDQERMLIISSHETEIASRYIDREYRIEKGVMQQRTRRLYRRVFDERGEEKSKSLSESENVINKKLVIEHDER